jgi:hypothetical protein
MTTPSHFPTHTARPSFETIVVSVDDSGRYPLAATVRLLPGQFDVNAYKSKNPPQYRPVYTLGSLVLVQSNGEYTQVGMVTDVFEENHVPCLMINTWPLLENIKPNPSLRPMEGREFNPSRFHGRSVSYFFEGQADNRSFKGKVMKLSHSEADTLLAHISHATPEVIREIFWSEAELQFIHAQEAAQTHYVELANAWIASL